MSERTPGLHDGFGRRISYLRLSVIDRCDLRCFYCLPRTYRGFQTPSHWLSPAHIDRVVRAFVALGVRHVRVTGGEPLVRPEILEIVRRLGAVSGVEDLSLSTNGARLARVAEDLCAAGVRRVNLSLDSLDPERFRRITGGDLAAVLRGLDAADRAGFRPDQIGRPMSALGG